MDTSAFGDLILFWIFLVGTVVVVVAAIVIFVLAVKRREGVGVAARKFFSTLFDNLPFF